MNPNNYFDEFIADNYQWSDAAVVQLKTKLLKEKPARISLYKDMSYEDLVTITREHSDFYNFYRIMLRRCYDENHFQYRHWGRRGVGIKTDWRYNKLIGFKNFIIDVGVMDYRNFSLTMNPEAHLMNEQTVYWEMRFSKHNGLTDNEREKIKTEKEPFKGKSLTLDINQGIDATSVMF